MVKDLSSFLSALSPILFIWVGNVEFGPPHIFSMNFSAIKRNPAFANAIQKSFANQTVTLARTVEEDADQFTFQCISCSVVIVEEVGEYNCPHCEGMMEEEEEEEDEEEEDEK